VEFIYWFVVSLQSNELKLSRAWRDR
jgi:hypothetical protein